MRFLVFQHIGVEHPGILREFIAADGHLWDAVEFDRGDAVPSNLEAYDALLVMGGPMDVWQEAQFPWLAVEKAAIRDWVVAHRKPFLGICLGHQLLAEAIGGHVGPMNGSEVGVCGVRRLPKGRQDVLLQGVQDEFECFQWHSAEVKSLPASAIVTVGNPACAIQAFSYGQHAFGLQFHVEITSDTVRQWGDVPAYRRSLEEALGPDSLVRLESQAAERLIRFNGMARRIYSNFSQVVRDAADATMLPGRAASANPVALETAQPLSGTE